jgi:hypothetical protein
MKKTFARKNKRNPKKGSHGETTATRGAYEVAAW